MIKVEIRIAGVLIGVEQIKVNEVSRIESAGFQLSIVK